MALLNWLWNLFAKPSTPFSSNFSRTLFKPSLHPQEFDPQALLGRDHCHSLCRALVPLADVSCNKHHLIDSSFAGYKESDQKHLYVVQSLAHEDPACSKSFLTSDFLLQNTFTHFMSKVKSPILVVKRPNTIQSNLFDNNKKGDLEK